MKALTVFMIVMIASTAWAADTDTDADTDIPAGKPRAGQTLKAAKVVGKRFGGQKVHYVPKGSPLARNPYPPKPKHHKKPEPKVIVEAEDVTRWGADKPATPGVLKSGVTACQSQGGVCKDVSTCAGNTQSGLCPGASNIKCCFSSGSNAGSCLKGYDGSKVLAKAKEYQAAYQRAGTKYSQANRQFGINAKYADCSSYVTSILQDTGYDCLFAAGRYTSYMNQQIRPRGGYSTSANPGDIIMWGGHTGIVTQNCGGGKYAFTAMGNSGARISPCMTLSQAANWGSGGILGFWHPRP